MKISFSNQFLGCVIISALMTLALCKAFLSPIDYNQSISSLAFLSYLYAIGIKCIIAMWLLTIDRFVALREKKNYFTGF